MRNYRRQAGRTGLKGEQGSRPEPDDVKDQEEGVTNYLRNQEKDQNEECGSSH